MFHVVMFENLFQVETFTHRWPNLFPETDMAIILKYNSSSPLFPPMDYMLIPEDLGCYVATLLNTD